MEPVSVRIVLTPRYVVGMTWITCWWAIAIFTPIGIASLFLGIATADATNGPDMSLILPGVSLVIGVWLVLPLLTVWRLRGSLGQPIEVEFSDAGMRQDTDGRHFQGDWSVITSATKRGPYLLVKTKGGGTTGLPIADFASPATAEALQATIRVRIKVSQAIASTRS